MNQQNAFDRIAELEAKLKIATENAAQAVKERDETLNTLQEKDKRLLAKTSELEQWKAEAYKWRRIRTPTHGTCCTCQGCGQSHEDCKCSEEELEDALNQACKERDELRERLVQAEGDRDDSDTVAANIAKRAASVLKELKEWRAITVHGWCQARLDKIIADLDWMDDKAANGEDGKP